MQGDGPTTGGNKTKMNAVIASTSGVALDIVGLKMAGLDLEKSFITTIALKNNIELSNKKSLFVFASGEAFNGIAGANNIVIPYSKENATSLVFDESVKKYKYCVVSLT